MQDMAVRVIEDFIEQYLIHLCTHSEETQQVVQ